MNSLLNSSVWAARFCAILVGISCKSSTSEDDAGPNVSFDSVVRPDVYESTDLNVLSNEEANSVATTPPVAVRQVFANGGAPCALMETGDVYCWGVNLYRSSLGTVRDWVRPRRILGLRSIVKYAQSWAAACGIDRERHVWCFGYNYFGVLGTSSVAYFLESAERRTDIDNVTEVGMSSYSMLGVRQDGSLYGRRPGSSFQRINVPSTVTAVQSGSGYCAVLSTGEVACQREFVEDTFRNPVIVSGLSEVTSVAVGYDLFCALKRDGTVWCWGHNAVGQTGTPPEQSEVCVDPDQSGGVHRTYRCVPRPQQVMGLAEVVEVSADGGLVCARRRDGTVWCWGENRTPRFAAIPDQGTVGDGLPNTELCSQAPWIPMDQTPSPIPCRRRPSQVAGLQDVRQISVGGRVVCVLRASGEVWCWGDNVLGDLGDGTTTSRAYPAPVLWPVTTRDE